MYYNRNRFHSTPFPNHIIPTSELIDQKQNKTIEDSHKTSCAVSRLLGSRTSIFLTKSFALSDILGQGSEVKSRSPCRTCSNIPCSDST